MIESKTLIQTLFKINGLPLIPSPTQVKIFDEIYYQKHRYAITIMPTQVGKSAIVSAAALLRSLVHKQDVVIVAPSEPKAQIIMGYIRNHCFDNEFFTSQLELDENESLDRLRKERSRKKITWKHGGSVRTVSVNARQADNPEAAMGEGAPVIIIDESCLIPDLLYATIVRMTSGFPYEQTQIFEISNPFYRNHFYRSWQDPDYFKIFLNYNGAISEGRLDPRKIEKAKQLPLFSVLYECQFPDESQIDAEGFRQLVATEQLKESTIYEEPKFGELRLGVDVGAGGDESVFVIRDDNFAKVIEKTKMQNTMSTVASIEETIEKYHIKPNNVFIDDIGVGRGVCDRLQEKGLDVNGVNVGDRPIMEQARERYFNVKAENYLALANWLEGGGQLVVDEDWQQLTWIKFKVNSDKNIQIERKEKLKARMGRSPDTAEALMLTFTVKQPQPRSWTI